ncbi:MAG: SCP2 sterol-binding domain-containing protein [Deltaproteobacteria bacterium]|nr:SCP2 sterol-binding domain-containing protein [Deltaproteobacteria bacterium]
MGIPFPSEEWIVAFKGKINSNPNYKESGANWEHGTISLIMQFDQDMLDRMKKDPVLSKQMKEGETAVGVWLDLYHGVCKEAKRVTAEEAQKAKFVIAGEYPRWKSVMKKELDPVKGMMQGKLKLKGDLPTIVRFVKAAQDLVDSATMVDTKFIDE